MVIYFYMIKKITNMKKIVLILFCLLSMFSFAACAQELNGEAFVIVDMMNAFLIVICSIFIFAIVGTLRNKSLLALIKSAHFFRIRSVITAWTLLGSAVLLYAMTEMLFAFKVLTDGAAYRLLKTVFGVFFSAGLFIQYRAIITYVNQMKSAVTKTNDSKEEES